MRKLSKDFEKFLNKVEQVEYEKSRYEKSARIEKPQQRQPRMSSDDLAMVLVFLIAMLFIFGIFALMVLS